MILNWKEYQAGEEPQDTLSIIRHPENVWKIPDIRIATEAGDKIGLKYEEGLHDLDANIAITTSVESGIAMRERVLGIKPLDTETLEARRIRVLLKWYDKTPYTIRSLRRILKNSFGDADVTVELDGDHQILTCTIGIIDSTVYKSVYELLEDMVPVNYVIKLISNLDCRTDSSLYFGMATQARTTVQIRDEGLTGMGFSNAVIYVGMATRAKITVPIKDGGLTDAEL